MDYINLSFPLGDIRALLEIMARLREGCPWDKEQNFKSLIPFSIEEIYELIEAVENNDIGNIKEELGDILFHIVFYSEIAKEDKLFSFADVVEGITRKMYFRHPHVFGDKKVETAAEQTLEWEKIKEKERSNLSLMDGIIKSLPALLRALKLQKRAAQIGFDWENPTQVLNKLEEEIAELKEEISSDNKDKIKDELGDVLFTCVNLARKLKIDPEIALRHANDKFEKRFRAMENIVDVKVSSLKEMDEAWNNVKKQK